MGVYGIDFYGVGRFGRDPALIRPDFSVDPFVSTPLDYSTLHISWVQPHSSDCSLLQLVRNTYNLPQDVDDGAQLFDSGGWPVAGASSFTDRGLGSGFYYYTMWGWSISDKLWIRCSDLIGLVPLNWGYGYRLYNLLPSAYRDRDIVLVDPYNPWPVDSPNPPLQRFLALIGFQMDFIRTELESLMSINDAQNCSGALLPLMAQQFGLPHEPEIGMQQERQLLQNAVHLYKLKGSPRGITEFSSILTSYPSAVLVHHGYNDLLTVDDSVFTDSEGTWQPWPPKGTNFPAITGNVGLSLAYNPNMLTGPSAVAGMTNPLELYPGFNPGPPTYNYSGLEIAAAGTNILSAENFSFEGGTTGNWVAAANCAVSNQPQGSVGSRSLGVNTTRSNVAGGAQALLSAIPVTASRSYLVSADFLGSTTNRQVSITVTFFNAGGTNLGSVTGSQQTETTGVWATATVTGTSPATAATATITVTVIGAANGELHMVDNILAGAGGTDIYITTGGVPITDFMSSTYGPGHITFQCQIWSNTGPRQVELSIWGDNGNKVPQQIVAPTLFTETLNDWKMMTVTGTVNPYPGKVPGDTKPSGSASYYWIYPRIRIIGVTTGTHYLTLAGLWPCTPAQIGVDTPVYDYPRDVKIVLQPQYANLLSNTLTTFTTTNPNPPPAQVGIGFDGLCTSADPENPGNPTCNIVARYQTVEDPPNSIAVNGNAALEVDASGPNATVWFGTISAFSPPPPSPYGWFASPRTNPVPAYTDGHTNDWFPGAISGPASSRPWFDPVNSWFFINQTYFGIGAAIVNGSWFAVPPQPPQNCNLNQFNVANGQPFNFSVYAKYLTVQDPTNATIILGYRWYFPDGTWTESQASAQATLTDTYQRYAVAPSNSLAALGEPPIEPSTGQMAVQVYPYVRFPSAQLASFLLNSAMLAPGTAIPPYMDATSVPASTGEFVQSSTGASYFYRRRTPRIARLNAELYRWLPMNSTYSLVYGSGAVLPPLDPTTWP